MTDFYTAINISTSMVKRLLFELGIHGVVYNNNEIKFSSTYCIHFLLLYDICNENFLFDFHGLNTLLLTFPHVAGKA